MSAESAEGAGAASAARRRQRMLKLRTKAAAKTAYEDFDCDSSISGDADCAGGDDVKKQQRMIRNRESAAASRKRKRDEVNKLKAQVEKLQKENLELRLRCQTFEGDCGSVQRRTKDRKSTRLNSSH